MSETNREVVPHPAVNRDRTVDLSAMSTDQLEAAWRAGLQATAEDFLWLAAIVSEFERRGCDVSSLRGGTGNLVRWLQAIAAKKLAAEAVAAFFGRPRLLVALYGMSLERQRAFVGGEKVQVVDPNTPSTVNEMTLAEIPDAHLGVIFGDEGVRSPSAQRLELRPHRRNKSERRKPHFRPVVDTETGDLRVGNMMVKPVDLVVALASAGGPDKPPASDVPDDYITVKVMLSKEESAKFNLSCSGLGGLSHSDTLRHIMKLFGLI